MASNSKLTREQKHELKLFKANMPKNMAFAASGNVTVLAQVDTNVVRFATSVANPDELKLRRKVGEWYAMDRFMAGQNSVMPRTQYDAAQDNAQYVACILT